MTEIRAELEEWKAAAYGSRETPLLASIYAQTGLTQGNARLLARLIERPGMLNTADELYRVVATRDPSDLMSVPSSRVGVHISHVRSALRPLGLPLPITVPSTGWLYRVEDARVMLDFLTPKV